MCWLPQFVFGRVPRVSIVVHLSGFIAGNIRSFCCFSCLLAMRARFKVLDSSHTFLPFLNSINACTSYRTYFFLNGLPLSISSTIAGPYSDKRLVFISELPHSKMPRVQEGRLCPTSKLSCRVSAIFRICQHSGFRFRTSRS